MMGSKPAALLLLLGLSLSSAAVCARDGSSGFVDRTLSLGSQKHRYQVYLPPAWNEGTSWPVILFLHGARERGSDGRRPTHQGLGPAIRENPSRFPCIVVFPQCPDDRWWPEPDMDRLALEALDESVLDFHGDPGRISLTGVSMGGIGTWSLATRHPGKFAAIVPVCGGIVAPGGPSPRGQDAPAAGETGGAYAETARRIGRTPVWIFHGAKDAVEPVSEARRMEAALKKAGGSVRYTEYPGVGHDVWDKAYSEPQLLPWLLSQRHAD